MYVTCVGHSLWCCIRFPLNADGAMGGGGENYTSGGDAAARNTCS